MNKETCYPFTKWLMDKVVAISFLFLLAPFFLLAVLIMAISMIRNPADRGPWLYRERRISAGEPFEVLKFRVLKAAVLAQAKREGKHARPFEKDPANLTWAGRILLKKWYLDELPQLFNILRGDMSLVGPRPWPVHMVEKQVAQGITYRLLLHAGWTGPAQTAKGKSRRLHSVQLDVTYWARCRSYTPYQLLQYDWHILRETVRTMTEGKGLKF